MAGIAIWVTAAFMVVAGVIAARALAGASPTPQSGGFGGRPAAYQLHLDTDAESGTLRQVPCARGARPGTTCWLR